MALKKYCRCGKTIPIKDRSCSECKSYYDVQDAKYNKKYDKTKRMNADFYDSNEWKHLRDTVKRNAKGLDLYDYYMNRKVTTATTVHHIVELKEDYSKRLDITNLIPLSGANHSKIHKLYFKKKKQTQEILFKILDQAKNDGLW